MASVAENGSVTTQVDESLYSRQLYVLGREAMLKMANSSALIVGLDGLGVEVAKNVILGGLKSVSLFDEQVVTVDDLATNYYANEASVGVNRVDVVIQELRDLNSYVHVEKAEGEKLLESVLGKYQVVVLCNRPLAEQLRIGEACHKHEPAVAFIAIESRGLFGKLFCDFGPQFTVYDSTGEPSATAIVASIDSSETGEVTLQEDSRFPFSDGDLVTFSEVKGMPSLNCGPPRKVKVTGRFTLEIGDTRQLGEYQSGGIVTQFCPPVNLSFKSIVESIREPSFCETDFGKPDRCAKLHLLFQMLHAFAEKHDGAWPRAFHKDDANEFVQLVQVRAKESNLEIEESLCRQFAYIISGSLCPLHAVMGGIAAQEVMKACTGKFTPVTQWLYFDALECLPQDYEQVCETTCDDQLKRYSAQCRIFGCEFQKRLASLKYFVVGSGAIGCELLKNLAMLGVGLKSHGGRIYITDMDKIEKSNLNRQFLFRPKDVGCSKSLVAARVATTMNPALDIVAYENRVGVETEQLYNDEFFESLDGVANALDNVEARLYVDRRCVYYRKSLLDSGTLGTKANVQVVVPGLTEAYSSSADPPEKQIPICTLKHFPSAIEHTLQWARELFEGQFHSAAEFASRYLNEPRYVESVIKQGEAQATEVLEQVHNLLYSERCENFADCVKWARLTFEDHFANEIKQLLHNFPSDHRNSDGQPFWGGPKRCPHPLDFDINNPLHMDFVEAAANLRAFVFGIAQVRDRAQLKQLITAIQVPPFSPRQNIKIAVNENEAADDAANAVPVDKLADLVTALVNVQTCPKVQLTAAEFEKDDDSNFHMQFIAAASNLRAANYDITQADMHKGKLIAGRIIPAIATTTSCVVGLVCLELIKLAQGQTDLGRFKNAFINLALPYFGFSEPLQPAKKKYYDVEWTLWDRFEIPAQEPEMTLGQLRKHFLEQYKMDISMLSNGVTMVYSFFMQPGKLKEREALPVSEAVKRSSQRVIPKWCKALVLEMLAADTDGNDLETPFIQYRLPANASGYLDDLPIDKQNAK